MALIFWTLKTAIDGKTFDIDLHNLHKISYVYNEMYEAILHIYLPIVMMYKTSKRYILRSIWINQMQWSYNNFNIMSVYYARRPVIIGQ